jgi:hypothetical protein
MTCSLLQDFSPLNGLANVRISGCTGFTDGNQVKDVRKLILERCSKFTDSSSLGNVEDLTLYYCGQLISLKGLVGVPKLCVYADDNLDDITDLTTPIVGNKIVFYFSSDVESNRFIKKHHHVLKANPMIQVCEDSGSAKFFETVKAEGIEEKFRF